MPLDVAQPAPRLGHWRSTLLVAAVVLAAYLLLLNPFWTPGGDSELFIAAARSIVRGEGYTYNGKIVRIAPPAWPYVMAAAMWISPTFLMLKAVTLSLMAGTWVMAHRVLLRLCPPSWATASTITAALLVPVYSLTFWLHSEPLFCAFAWGATLMAVRFVEDRRRSWDLFGVILLCGAMAGVRWTSGLQWGIVAGVLAGALLRPPVRARREIDVRELGPLEYGPPVDPACRFDFRATLGLGLSGLITILVFLLLFFGLPAMVSAAAVPDLPVTTQDAEDGTPHLVDNTIFQDLSPLEERLVRLVAAGHWPAWALWYPTRFAGGMSALAWIPLTLGWLVIALLCLAAWQAIRGRGPVSQWPIGRLLWPVVVGYLFLLVLIWPLPNARYLVPIAPLIIAGVLWGCAGLGDVVRRPGLGRVLRGLFLVSLLLANGGMFAIDAAIQRSGDPLVGGTPQRYYRNYEAGLHVSLLSALDKVRREGVMDNELAVSERYFNLNRMRFSKGGPRNVVMLLDREIVFVPQVYSFVPDEIPRKLFRDGRVYPGGFAEWAERNGVKYYLYQQPSEPWRLWHFRVPQSLQAQLAGGDPQPPTFGWLLFTEEDGFSRPVALPDDFSAPTRIPGL